MEYTPVVGSRALPVSVVARRLSLSERSVYRAIAVGELEAFRVGRSIRVSEAVLARLLSPKETVWPTHDNSDTISIRDDAMLSVRPVLSAREGLGGSASSHGASRDLPAREVEP